MIDAVMGGALIAIAAFTLGSALGNIWASDNFASDCNKLNRVVVKSVAYECKSLKETAK